MEAARHRGEVHEGCKNDLLAVRGERSSSGGQSLIIIDFSDLRRRHLDIAWRWDYRVW